MVAGQGMPFEEDSVPVEDSIPADGLRLNREISDIVDIAGGVDDESVLHDLTVDEWIQAVGGMNPYEQLVIGAFNASSRHRSVASGHPQGIATFVDSASDDE